MGSLISAVKNLPEIPFVFAGSGPMEAEFKGIDNIENRGFMSGEALHTLIRQAKFSIYPSEWYENCPFAVMESISYGTPVVGANIGGIPELLITNNSKNDKKWCRYIYRNWSWKSSCGIKQKDR